MLLGLARGSGTRSLAGMAARAGVYRRPLLDLPRDVVVAAALEAAAADPRLEPWSDPHNTDAGFARVRVRHEVLPVLEAALGPGIVEALARTADAGARGRRRPGRLGRASVGAGPRARLTPAAPTPRPDHAGPAPRPLRRALVRPIVEGCCRKRSKNLPRSPSRPPAPPASRPAGPDRAAHRRADHRGGAASPGDRAPGGPPLAHRGRLPRRLADGRSHPRRGRVARAWGVRCAPKWPCPAADVPAGRTAPWL